MSPIRVLWVIKGLGPGGAERLLVTHARFGDHENFDYSAAFMVPGKNQVVPLLARHGVESTCLGTGHDFDPRWVFRLWRHLRTGRFDVVHTHSPQPAAVTRVVVRLLPKTRRPGLVHTEHNEWGKHRRSTRWLNRRTMRWAGNVVAVSRGVAESMRGLDDVMVLYHGVDVDAVRATADRSGVRHELGIPDDAYVIGTVANLRWEKGNDLLLRAARSLLFDHGGPSDTWFISVGQGPLEEDMRTLHAQLGLGDRFRLLGYREDATRVMSAFDVFCLPSRHEGLPVVLMEAAALGLPLVAADVGGVAEIVPDAGLVPPEDVSAIVAKLDDMRGRPVGSSSARAGLDFDGRNFVASLEDLYRLARR